jgi:hypothetical protein
VLATNTPVRAGYDKNPLTAFTLVTSQHFHEYDSTENTMLEKAKDVRRLE